MPAGGLFGILAFFLFTFSSLFLFLFLFLNIMYLNPVCEKEGAKWDRLETERKGGKFSNLVQVWGNASEKKRQIFFH